MSELTEQYIQDSFHSYLKSSLTQAKVEKLVDEELLSSAAGDLMITGPALCLYFAALRCTTSPPSVPLPRHNKTSQPMELSPENCPPAFTAFLRVWSSRVDAIQSLAPEHQHDLARIICNLEPVAQPTDRSLPGIAADLRAVAIEISQRRSFQDRYASDLQAALDSGSTSPGVKLKASFVPPPSYDDSPSSSTQSSPQYANHDLPPQSPSHLSPYAEKGGYTSKSHHALLSPDSPGIEFIRETLYASLADVLERQPSLRRLLRRDPSRAYFASVAFSILDIATNSMTPDGGVIGVLGKPLTLGDCPVELRPFMIELGSIGGQARELEEADDQTAMECAALDKEIPTSRMERVRRMLEEGVGYEEGRRDHETGRRSVEGRAVAFTNRINALSLGMTRLKAFRERQDDVFKVLAGIGQ